MRARLDIRGGHWRDTDKLAVYDTWAPGTSLSMCRTPTESARSLSRWRRRFGRRGRGATDGRAEPYGGRDRAEGATARGASRGGGSGAVRWA